MSFMEHAFNEMKAIDPSITSDQFSRNWLNKCSSYYRSYNRKLPKKKDAKNTEKGRVRGV